MTSRRLKIAFDEHMPAAITDALEILNTSKKSKSRKLGYLMCRSKDYNPKESDADYVEKSDVPWMCRFASDSGRGVISANVDMLEKPHEVQAIIEQNLILILFDAQWNDWDWHHKSASILFWWSRIMQTINDKKPGTVWRVPAKWNGQRELRQINFQIRLGRKPNKQNSIDANSRQRKTKPKQLKSSDQRQRKLEI